MLFYLEKVGRRLPLLIGTIGTICCHVALAITFHVNTFDKCPADGHSDSTTIFPHTGKSVAVMLLIWGLMFCWNLSWAGLMFVVASEVLPSNIRGVGMGIAIAGFWILSFLFQLIFRLLILTITPTGNLSINQQIISRPFDSFFFRNIYTASLDFSYCCRLRLVRCA